MCVCVCVCVCVRVCVCVFSIGVTRQCVRSDCRRRVKGREFWKKMDDLRERLRKRERRSVGVRGELEKMRVEKREIEREREKGKRGRKNVRKK